MEKQFNVPAFTRSYIAHLCELPSCSWHILCWLFGFYSPLLPHRKFARMGIENSYFFFSFFQIFMCPCSHIGKLSRTWKSHGFQKSLLLQSPLSPLPRWKPRDFYNMHVHNSQHHFFFNSLHHSPYWIFYSCDAHHLPQNLVKVSYFSALLWP